MTVRHIQTLPLLLLSLTINAQHTIVITSNIVNTNEKTLIPEGIFGVHNGNFTGFDNSIAMDWGIRSARYISNNPGFPTEPGSGAPDSLQFTVNCWYDRFTPPLLLTDANWKRTLQQKAHTFATTANAGGYTRHLEFWNEPYLNWAYKPGNSTDPAFYNTTAISRYAPVYRLGSSTAEPYLIWDSAQWYDSPYWAADRLRIYNAISAEWNKVISAGCPYPCYNALKNDSIYRQGTSSEFTVRRKLRPVDTTQISYYSSRQNETYYSQMYAIVADTIRKLDPSIQLIAG